MRGKQVTRATCTLGLVIYLVCPCVGPHYEVLYFVSNGKGAYCIISNSMYINWLSPETVIYQSKKCQTHHLSEIRVLRS